LAAPRRRSIQVVVQRQQAGQVKVRVFDGQGNAVRDLFEGQLQPGRWVLDWDGRNDAGQLVSAGRYQVQVTDENGSHEREVEVFGGAR
jgi:flagellar basal-body rod modification protein FlgD